MARPVPAAERLRGPAGRRDRWLALGGLAVLLLLAYAVFVHPWWTVPMREAGARIDSLQQRELRLRMQLQQAPQVSERLAQVRARQGDRPGFIAESNPELATASLIQRLETTVAQASPGNRSCAITNRSPLQPDTAGDHVRVVVQVRLRCGTPELASVLHSLESGTPRLFVGNLSILAQRMYFSPGRERAAENGGLDVAFDLYGYLAPTTEVAGAD